MHPLVQIPEQFIEENTVFLELIQHLKRSFSGSDVWVPQRHHHDFPNPITHKDSTLLLMPAWNPGKDAGVKIVTVSPENGRFNLPSINGTYIYFDAANGTLKAILEAKSLTAKRTAATSALASSYLSKADSSSLLMIGTGALATNLIKAHASVRPIKNVYVWGRDFKKAQTICAQLSNESFMATPIKSIAEKIAEVDLKLRGPGNIMGTQQSGVLNLKIADVVKDSSILVAARNAAIALLSEDANLSNPANATILNTYTKLQKTSGLWANIS